MIDLTIFDNTFTMSILAAQSFEMLILAIVTIFMALITTEKETVNTFMYVFFQLIIVSAGYVWLVGDTPNTLYATYNEIMATGKSEFVPEMFKYMGVAFALNLIIKGQVTLFSTFIIFTMFNMIVAKGALGVEYFVYLFIALYGVYFIMSFLTSDPEPLYGKGRYE